MGIGASHSKIHATTCKKCKKVCVFGKVKNHEEIWQRWSIHKKLFLKGIIHKPRGQLRGGGLAK